MIVQATKWCPQCKRSLPLSAYTKDRSKTSGLRSHCKSCRRVRRARERAVPENRARQREYQIKWKYGTDEVFANRLLKVPVCQSCGMEFSSAGDERIDHCHENGHVRGVLCHRCNMAAIGTSEEAIHRLRGLIAFLERDLEWQSL